MTIPVNIISNADDFGYNHSVNMAILYCYEMGYINSTSLMVNTGSFEEAVELIQKNPIISNVGIHINFSEGKPLSNFSQQDYLEENGNWDLKSVNKKYNYFSKETRNAFFNELEIQINKALSAKVLITHIDSHHHLHTLPCFYKLFMEAAKRYKLKIRLAQTYNEGNLIKFYLRKYINSKFKSAGSNYSEYFETVEYFLKNRKTGNKPIEVMLHPFFNAQGDLKDHYTAPAMQDWISFLEQTNTSSRLL